MTPRTSGSRGRAPAQCCEYEMLWALFFGENKSDGASTVSCCFTLCHSVWEGSSTKQHKSRFMFFPRKLSLLIGVFACVMRNYPHTCRKDYSVSYQISFETAVFGYTALAIGILSLWKHWSTILWNLGCCNTPEIEHQLSCHSSRCRSGKVKLKTTGAFSFHWFQWKQGTAFVGLARCSVRKAGTGTGTFQTGTGTHLTSAQAFPTSTHHQVSHFLAFHQPVSSL